MDRRDKRFPNPLAPWYVVQNKSGWKYLNEDGIFTEKKSEAIIYTGLGDACRAAESYSAHVRVLYTKKQAIEFGRFEEEELIEL